MRGATDIISSFRMSSRNAAVELALTCRAEKENRAVYLCRVPSYGDLPVIAPALLVKPSPAGTALQTAEAGDEAPLFSSVVPEDMARSLSRSARLVHVTLQRLPHHSRYSALRPVRWSAQLSRCCDDHLESSAIACRAGCVMSWAARPNMQRPGPLRADSQTELTDWCGSS